MKTFKDYLQEISLKTKANAYKELKYQERQTRLKKKIDPKGRFPQTPSDNQMKSLNKRVDSMSKAIRKDSHGDKVVKGIDKKTDAAGYVKNKASQDPMVRKQERMKHVDKRTKSVEPKLFSKTTSRYDQNTQDQLKKAQNLSPNNIRGAYEITKAGKLKSLNKKPKLPK